MKSEEVITISSDDDDDKTFGDQLAEPLSCCFCDRELGHKHTPIVLERCRHQFCKQCLLDVIQLNPNRKVKCPLSYLKGRGCDQFLQDPEVKAIVTESYYQLNYLNRPLFQRGAAEAIQSLHRQKFDEFQGRSKKFFTFSVAQGRGVMPVMGQVKVLERYFDNVGQASKPYPNVLSIGRGISYNEKENEPVPMLFDHPATYFKKPKAEEEAEWNFWKGLGSPPKKQKSGTKLPMPTLKEDDNEVPLLVPNPFAQLVPNPLYNEGNENTNDTSLD